MVEPGTAAWNKIRQHFGEHFFHEDGTLNREKLGELIFSDESKRQELNKIVHPEISKWMKWQILRHFLKGKHGKRTQYVT